MELKEKVVNYELKDTIDLMNSEDYKERFQAEYLQVKIRYDKLCDMLVRLDAGTLNFKPTCPIQVLVEQKNSMDRYMHILKVRAEIEGINLTQF